MARRLSRDSLIGFGFVVFGFALAFWQRPGKATSDTKIDLHVSPGSFVESVTSAWSPSIDLGAVQSAQYTGYAWPMGRVFAVLHELGLEPWVAHRIWLGLLYALAAWGMVRLMDAIAGRPRGIAHLVAGALYVLNPYVVVFTGRTSATLVGYVALPWLLLAVLRGVRAVAAAKSWRDPTGWWWVAAFALILTSAGGGINGAVVGWMLVGPLLLLVYEPLRRAVRRRDSTRFALRVAVLGGLASLWWIVPLGVHAAFGNDFLQFTEQPNSIWGTNSAPEALRLLAYWTTYIGVGFAGPDQPLFTEAATLLFNPFVVGASLLIPALAVAAFAVTRRHPYAPFLLLLVVVGALIEVAGFPNGTPSRAGMEFVYENFPLVRFMRTTQKAAPLVAAGGAGLVGLGARWAWLLLRSLDARPRRVASVALPAGLALLIVLAALPLARGTAVEKQLTWDRIPRAWTEAGEDLDRSLPANTRALVLPGQIFAHYRWGETVDAILPRVTDSPVAVRYETPYSDPHATDLLWTVDRLVSQRRLVPGQLPPLLRLIGAGAVITGSDDDPSRSGSPEPAAAAAELAAQGLGDPTRAFGPARTVAPMEGDGGRGPSLPEVRRYDVPPGRGIVSVAPRERPTVVDGGAEGLAGLAAFGALPERRAILYAGDLSDAELREEARRGADVVVTDSNRRRRFVPNFGYQNLGPTLRETDALDRSFAEIDPFPGRGPNAQTVSALRGARYVRAPAQGGLLEFPERSAVKAFDGDRSTVWAADRYLRPQSRWIEVGFERARDVPWIELDPIQDRYGVEQEVEIEGIRARLHEGVNRVRLGLRNVRGIRVQITKVRQPRGDLRGSGGFREIRIPGLRVHERLRAPLLVGRALAGRDDLSHAPLSYVFQRSSADEPFRRDRYGASPLLELRRDRADSERQLDRIVFAPAARRYTAQAWVHPAVEAADSQLDQIAGLRGRARFDSSGRFRNAPRFRASSAFDGRQDTAWIGIEVPGSAPRPWLSWSLPESLTLSRARVRTASGQVRRPTRVQLSSGARSTPPLPIARDGTVRLARPLRGRSFRLTVLSSEPPAPGGRRERALRQVGIASVEVPGLEHVGVVRNGSLRASCHTVRLDVGGRTLGLKPRGTLAQLDAGRPLRAQSCGAALPMARGVQRVRSVAGPFSVDLLRLSSPAPAPVAVPPARGRVLDPGRLSDSEITGVRLNVPRAAWLVMGQSYSRGWRGSCDGRSLGQPRPINGYANGWRAPAGCRRASFSFTPQRAENAGYAISGLVGAALLVFLVAARRKVRGIAGPSVAQRDEGESEPGMPLWRAATIALAASVPLTLLFALRAGLVIMPLLTLILWRGVADRTLALVAAGLLGVGVPVAYLAATPRDRGGFNFEYSLETLWGHWIGVAALVLLSVVCWRSIGRARSAASAPGSGSP